MVNDMINLVFQIKKYDKLEAVEERRKLAREIYDNFIMKELLAHSHVSTTISLMCLNRATFRHD